MQRETRQDHEIEAAHIVLFVRSYSTRSPLGFLHEILNYTSSKPKIPCEIRSWRYKSRRLQKKYEAREKAKKQIISLGVSEKSFWFFLKLRFFFFRILVFFLMRCNGWFPITIFKNSSSWWKRNGVTINTNGNEILQKQRNK